MKAGKVNVIEVNRIELPTIILRVRTSFLTVIHDRVPAPGKEELFHNLDATMHLQVTSSYLKEGVLITRLN